jgi:hypothetical protein
LKALARLNNLEAFINASEDAKGPSTALQDRYLAIFLHSARFKPLTLPALKGTT